MLAHAALLKQEIEAKLADRVPSALSPMAVRTATLHPIGVAAVDGLLGGGLPLGSICEVVGAAGSGRTTLAMSLLACATSDAACAYVDVQDTLCPASAAAAGVRLSNLLWVRLGQGAAVSSSSSTKQAGSTAEVNERTEHVFLRSEAEKGESKQVVREESVTLSHYLVNGTRQWGGHGVHPRMETKGLSPALEQMLFSKEERRRRKMEGTPSCPNQPLAGLAKASHDQIEWERFNSRKVDESDPLRQMDRKAAASARQRAAARVEAIAAPARQKCAWDQLDQAIRATDQVLQSGGFRVVVLDMAALPTEQASRVTAATWFRFRRAAQESNSILLVLAQAPCACSSAACALWCSPGKPPVVQGVLAGMSATTEVARQRTGAAMGKKIPGRAAMWDAPSPWMRAVGE